MDAGQIIDYINATLPGIVVSISCGDTIYVNQWEPSATDAQKQAVDDILKDPDLESKVALGTVAERIEKLCVAATNYQNSKSDSNGIIAMTGYFQSIQMLKIAGKLSSTCMEVDENYAWFQNIWAVYRTRKADLLANPDILPDLDFTSCGEPPHSITDMTVAAETLLSTIISN